MKITIRNIIGIIGIILTGILVMALCSYMLVPKSLRAYSLNDYTDLEENSIDVVTMGASSYWSGISPMVMWSETGVTSYNMSSSRIPPHIQYFFLKQVFETQKPKLIVTSMTFVEGEYDFENEEVFFIHGMDSRPLSKDKVDLAFDIQKEGGPNAFKYIFPILNHHNNWKDLKVRDFLFKEPNFTRGQRWPDFYIEDLTKEAAEIEEERKAEGKVEFKYDKQSINYYEKMIKLCEDNDAELVIMAMPNVRYKPKRELALEEFTAQKSLDYIDGNDEKFYKDAEINNSTDWRDDGHLNIWGSTKFSKFLANYLQSEYNVGNSKLSSDSYEDWLNDYKKYHEYYDVYQPGYLKSPEEVTNEK